MSEVQQSDHGSDGGKKNKQKKQTLRVDFTPMVDMNMLLITFFMFCTTLLKPQTLKIAFPAKDEVKEEDETKVRETSAVTLLLGDNDELFYYEGMLKEESYSMPDFLKPMGWGVDSLRAYLLGKNRGTYEKIEDLRKKLKAEEINEEQFNTQSKEIQDHAMKVEKIAPTVMIKPSDLATFMNMVDALDEMLICNIGVYAVMDITDGDRHLLYEKTKNPEYLTEEKRKDLSE
jgi:biopolymer transport protein ExbD